MNSGLGNTSEKLVSIVMPAYNCEKFVSTALESIINQTYRNWEVIVIDDCSTDNTYEMVKKYMKKDNRIKCYKLDKNSGAAIARNKAVEIAGGRYIAFLDSDDVWYKEKLNKQILFMEENSYNFTCTNYTKIDEKGKPLNYVIKTFEKYDYDKILKFCLGNSTVIYNADVLGKFTIPNIKKRNDYVMWLQIIKKAKYLYGMDEVLSSHRVRHDSLSSKKMNLVGYHWRIYRKIEKLSFIKSVLLIIYWINSAMFRLCKIR